MAVDKLSVSGLFELAGAIRDTSRGTALRREFGGGGVPELSVALTYGTTADKGDWLYYAERTLAATTFDLLDLSGSLTDGLGNTITATKLKFALVAIESPDGTKAVRVGPQNQTNAAQLHWGGTGATVYKTVTHWDLVVWEPVAGYTVTAATADIFPVYNPGGSAVTYHILLAGKS